MGTAGLARLHERVWALRHMGVQAPPSAGMHVHVNVGTPGVRGEPDQSPPERERLSPRQIASVWAAYARFQPVIDEHFLQDSRRLNPYCEGLYLETAALLPLHLAARGARTAVAMPPKPLSPTAIF